MYARAHAERHPDQPCVIMGGSGETPSYSQLETRAAGGRARSASPDGSMSTVGDAGYLDADGFDRQSRLV